MSNCADEDKNMFHFKLHAALTNARRDSKVALQRLTMSSGFGELDGKRGEP